MPDLQDRQHILHSITPDLNQTFLLERTLYAHGFSCVAGLDEAGRGPLAGPVVAACVVLPLQCDYTPFIDSKKLSGRQRLLLSRLLVDTGASCGTGVVSAATIDQINILQSSLLAMRRALEDMITKSGLSPDALLVDGKFPIPVSTLQRPLIRGESKSASIAAASILAKVTRDSLMEELDQQFPQYRFSRHKGYPTKEHRAIIANIGPSPCHRRSFKGVREFTDCKS